MKGYFRYYSYFARPFPRFTIGISPVSFSAPGNVFNHWATFCLFIFTTLIPSRHPHNSLVCCGVITMQSFMARIFTGIPLIKPARVNQSPPRRRYFMSMRAYSSQQAALSCGVSARGWTGAALGGLPCRRRALFLRTSSRFSIMLVKASDSVLQTVNSGLKFVAAIFNSSVVGSG